MPKLTDTQLVILSAAAKRDGGAVLPLPKSLKANDAAVARTVKSLVSRALVVERPAQRGDKPWREADDGARIALAITEAGLAAIGVDTESPTGARRGSAIVPSNKRASRSGRLARARQSMPDAAASKIRKGTKQALLIDLLKRNKGATIAEVVDATGWQPHSVRGAISGTLKKKLGLTVTSKTVARRGRVYRIVGAVQKAGR